MANASSVLRMAGMNSGFDTEAIVNALTATTKNKINTSERKVLKLQAQQEAYRTVISAFNEFKSKYFDIANISTCLKSGSLFNGYKSDISGFDGKTINGVKISCAANSNPGNYDVTVNQVATQATYKSSAASGTPLKISSCYGSESWRPTTNYTMNVTVNGKTKNVTFKGAADEATVRDNINAALKEAFGTASGGKGLVSIGTDNKITALDKSGVVATNPATMVSSKVLDFTNPKTGNNTYTVICNGSTKTVTFSTVSNDYFDEIFDGNTLREEPPATKADGTAYTEAEKQAYLDKVNLFKEVAQNTRGKDVYDSYTAWNSSLNETQKAQEYNNIINFQRDSELASEQERFEAEIKLEMYNEAVKEGIISDDSASVDYVDFDTYTKNITSSDINDYCDSNETANLMRDAHQSEVDRINTMCDNELTDLDDAKAALARKAYYADDTIDKDAVSVDDYVAANKGSYSDSDAHAYLFDNAVNPSKKQLYFEKNEYAGDDAETFLSNYDPTQAAKDLNKANIENNLGALTFGTVSMEVTVDDAGNATVKAKGATGSRSFAMTQNANNANHLSNVITESKAAGGGVASQIDTSSTIDALGLTAGADGKFSFTINGQSFSFDGTDTIRDVMKKVNASEAGVKMTYTSLTNQFTLTSNEYGMNANITVQDGAGGLLKALGFANRSGEVDDGGAGFTRGQNTILDINGTTVETESNSYEFDGITMSFTQAATGAHFSSEVQRDYSKPIQVIKDFVKDYNALIDLVNGYLNDKPNKDYYFLTDDDLDEMDLSESKEEKWEKMAKKGILYHDSAITGIMSKLRSAVYNTVEAPDGKNIGLFTLGITTTDNIANRGKLQFDPSIDDEKFEMIFSEYADEFATLFNDAEKGIANQFSDIIDSAVKTSGDIKECGVLVQKAGIAGTSSDTNNSIYRQIQSLKDTISSLQDRYDQQQDRYWKIYSNMETQLGNLNGQTSYISQLTSSLGG